MKGNLRVGNSIGNGTMTISFLTISSRSVMTVLVVTLFTIVPEFSSALANTDANADGKAAPARIVSLVPALTETLFALGVGDRVVGVSDFCDEPAAARLLPRVGTFVAPVAEAVLALNPDLVLTSPTPGNQSAVGALKRAGVRIGVVGGDASIQEVRRSILRTAALVGAQAEGQELLAAMTADLDWVRAAAAPEPRPLVALVIGSDPLVLAGASSYLGELLELAGAENLGAKLEGRWPRVGMEFLVSESPAVLIDVSTPMESEGGAQAARTSWERFPSLRAVADQRIHVLKASVLLRPGPRLGSAARRLFEVIHPEAALALKPEGDGSTAAGVFAPNN
ncbi:MAG: iron complex transport system substrate-binding protein [Hyphomicrobiaceae bacterium]